MAFEFVQQIAEVVPPPTEVFPRNELPRRTQAEPLYPKQLIGITLLVIFLLQAELSRYARKCCLATVTGDKGKQGGLPRSTALLGCSRRDRMKRAAVLAFMCLAPLAMASPAKASVIYTLTADHFGGAGSGTLGTVTVTTVSPGIVDMTISLNNGNRFVLTGQDGSTVGFNTNLTPDPTLTLVSSSLTGWTLDNAGVPTIPAGLGADGFGNF